MDTICLKTTLIQKLVAHHTEGKPTHGTYEAYLSKEVELFTNQADRYIKAAKEGRLVVREEGHSTSGGPTVMKFCELSKDPTGYHRVLNFNLLLTYLNYRPARNHQPGIATSGQYIDGVHENIINQLKDLGFLTQYQAQELSALVPHVL